MTTDKQDPSRMAFEMQMTSEGRSVNRSEAHNGYFAYETDVRWQTWQPAWQASREQALREVAEICKEQSIAGAYASHCYRIIKDLK